MSEQERIDKLEKKLAEWELIFTAWALFVLLAGVIAGLHIFVIK